jgi:hypothetical protein
LKIHNDILKIDKINSEVILEYSVLNCSNESLIAYGINGQITRTVIEENEYCNEDVAAGVVFYLYNEANKIFFPEVPLIPDSIDYKPMPQERLEALMHQSKIEFTKNTKVFKPQQRIEFKQKVRLEDCQLEKGTYYFQILYFSGKHITNYVTSEQIAKDKRTHKAGIYQGCVKSDKVKLVVN